MNIKIYDEFENIPILDSKRYHSKQEREIRETFKEYFEIQRKRIHKRILQNDH